MCIRKKSTRFATPMLGSQQRLADVAGEGDGRFVLVKTIGRRDLTHVIELTGARFLHTNLVTGDYGQEQDFAYPLIANIRDHAYLQVFNVQVCESQKTALSV